MLRPNCTKWPFCAKGRRAMTTTQKQGVLVTCIQQHRHVSMVYAFVVQNDGDPSTERDAQATLVTFVPRLPCVSVKGRHLFLLQ